MDIFANPCKEFCNFLNGPYKWRAETVAKDKLWAARCPDDHHACKADCSKGTPMTWQTKVIKVYTAAIKR